MVSGSAAEDDDAHLEEDDDVQLLTSYCRRPQHEACLAEIFRTEANDLITRLAIKRYDHAGFIPSEVLVTLARSHYGGSARVRNAIALALNDRLVIELRHFLNRNLQWYGVVARSSESAAEAVAEVRVRIFQSNVEISFAEVSFRTFVDKRLTDWFISQGRFKNKMPSVDGLKSDDDGDGNRLSAPTLLQSTNPMVAPTNVARQPMPNLSSFNPAKTGLSMRGLKNRQRRFKKYDVSGKRASTCAEVRVLARDCVTARAARCAPVCHARPG